MSQSHLVVSFLRGRIFLVLLVLALQCVLPLQVQADSPYTNSPGAIIAGFSCNSLEEYMNLFQAKNLGTIVFETVTEDLIPAVLDLTEATGEIRNLPKTLQECVDSMDWTLLQHSALCGMVYHGTGSILGVGATLRITPAGSDAGTLYQNLSGFLKTLATHSQGALTWTPGPEVCWLGVAAVTPATGVVSRPGGVLFLHKVDSSVILATDYLFSPSTPGLGPKANLEDLWKQLPEPVVSSVMVDFTELATLLKVSMKPVVDKIESEGSKPESSLVLDKTAEALFDKDPETLEKLRQVERDFNQIMPSTNSGSISKPLENIISLIKDQGILIAGTGSTPGGVMSTTLWSVDSTSTNGGLFEVQPLSATMLSLLQSGVVEVSVQGLPDYQRIYSTLADLIKQFPGGVDLYGEWESLQQTFGMTVEKDLLPAVGSEMGWVTREMEKSGVAGLQLMSNNLFYVLGLRDTAAAGRTVNKIEETLSKYGFPATATRVADVTISVLDTGILGKAMWTTLEQPPLFVLTTASSMQQFTDFLQLLKNPQPQGLSQHPRWEDLQRIWTEHPTAVTLSDLTTAWRQALDQLRSSQMMVALMGSSGSMSLPFIRMAIRILQNTPAPQWGFTVNTIESGLRVSRTLLLYPLVEKEGAQP